MRNIEHLTYTGEEGNKREVQGLGAKGAEPSSSQWCQIYRPSLPHLPWEGGEFHCRWNITTSPFTRLGQL